jgi:leucyl-tRNA synthetase
MEYNFIEIEKKWRKNWQERKTYNVSEDAAKKKYYVLDMFPYPSGAGLHVGHPLGYIASDIIARYKRHKGFNVLHPMGYDSFGLPAEQYAIQTGQHPAITTESNIARYREQLDKIGFCYDWDREVRTSDPSYYRWTQWIFTELFNSWYNLDSNKAEPISSLIQKLENNGTYNLNAAIDELWYKSLNPEFFPFLGEHFDGTLSSTDWSSFNEQQKELILMHFRLAYLADSWVNWCPALGTVLANDEVKDGVSERGGHPVVQKLMKQWSLRISAYAQRLIDDLNGIDWSESIKEMQRNWIGRSEGARVMFALDGFDSQIEVFTTRPDTIFGVSFMVLAPEHELVSIISSDAQKEELTAYIEKAMRKTERDRQSDVKSVSGCFTGAYAIHPFTGAKIPVWIADYVLASYGTGAVMAVPAGDERDHAFATYFKLPIPSIFKDIDTEKQAFSDKSAILCNSDFLNDLNAAEGIGRAIQELEDRGIGERKVNFRLRDAVFSRQRYWGEPFPVYYKNELPKVLPFEQLPVNLPEVDKYLPTEDGEPPLARAVNWKTADGDLMETNTMPGWAGSSWYFLRYMDPQNQERFVSPEKAAYWGQVDLYMGGAEHATGHLLYSRFWTKFFFDRGWISFTEPFAKMINQGMILGRSSFVYRLKNAEKTTFISYDLLNGEEVQQLHADIELVENDVLNIDKFKKWRPEFEHAEFILNEHGKYICGMEIEKMSKSKYNVQTPDDLVERYGADTLRCYEMFLGPVEQHKPWDTQGISGVHNFLKKLWRLYQDKDGNWAVSTEEPSKESLRSLHKTIKKVTEDLDRYSWNTVVSAMMIGVNELTEQQCKSGQVLEVLPVLLSPYAPHLAEEIWEKLGKQGSVCDASWPQVNADYLQSDTVNYPVQFNGKVRFQLELPVSFGPKEVEATVLANPQMEKYLDGKELKKIIVVPGRIVNVVV